MSFGVVQSAITSMKNNRKLLSKRKESKVLDGNYANVGLKDFPKATPKALQSLKEKLQREQKQRTVFNTVLFASIVVLVMLFGFYFMS